MPRRKTSNIGARYQSHVVAPGGEPLRFGATRTGPDAWFFAWVVAQKTTPRFVKNRGVVVRPLAVTYSRMA
jgi:hypothetical protein